MPRAGTHNWQNGANTDPTTTAQANLFHTAASSFGLSKTGAGTLTLSNANTFAGTISVQQGVLLSAANTR